MKQFFLKQNIVKSLFVIFLLSCAMKSVAQKSYYEIKIFKEIGATSWTYLKNGLKEAQEKQVDAVFLHLNTYGGQVDFADSMRTAILNY